MIIDLSLAVAGVLVTAGVVLGIVAVVGTTRPPRPPSSTIAAVGRWWRGTGRTRAERQARQTTIILAVVAGAATWLIVGWPAAGLIVAVAIPGIPWLFAAGSAETRAIARLEAVEAWTRRLADIVARGIGLQQAIVATAATAPDRIATEVIDLASRMQATGDPIYALRAFADDLNDYTADQVIAPLILHVSDRGDGLYDVLVDISRSIAAEVEMRSTVDAKRSGPRFAVRFLTGMSAVLIGIGLVSPQFLAPYQTFLGQALLIFLVAFYCALMWWVRALSLPPRRPRLLPSVDDDVVIGVRS
ncbi:type II secretion system F family protein [Actinoplanes regularis]|uniref:type II secretion system F family protein n=1 Tax=Actinoplanes regularis TaxID=52697 RepID=UPI0024A0261C|nr:type II secretion system F family protein [Actinoplanes regularis]GLW34479.1 hypothetical protein Areg01_74160 [Actinoplanes regularis]